MKPGRGEDDPLFSFGDLDVGWDATAGTKLGVGLVCSRAGLAAGLVRGWLN